MASIPCGTYQASHIHAHMRRQDMRNRHPSASSDSATSVNLADSTPETPPLQTSAKTYTMTFWSAMDRVSQWVGNNNQKNTKMPKVPENSMATVSVSNPGSIVQSDT